MDSWKENTWVVIPSYNESEMIRDVVKNVNSFGYQVVVVDDGSRDHVSKLLKNTGAHVCRHLSNLGQGAALQTGINYALKNDAEYIVTFDADGQHQASEIESVVIPLRDKDVDITLGTRFSLGGSAENIPPLKTIVLKLAILATRITTGLQLTDTHNGFRGLSRKAAITIKITQNGMAHASQILAEVKDQKLKYQEVPVTIIYSDYSMQKGQKISNAFNIAWDSMMEIFRK